MSRMTKSIRDQEELRLFRAYLRRRAALPNEDASLAYAETYGTVVYTAKHEVGETGFCQPREFPDSMLE